MSTVSSDPKSLIVQILTCSKSPESRLISATNALKALDLDLKIDIVNGFVAEDAIVDSLYDSVANHWRTKRPISRSEVAIYGSHRLAWQRFLDSDHDIALVLEDDFGLRDPARFAEILNNHSAVLGDTRDIVKLFDFEKRSKNRAVFTHRIGDIELVKWQAPTAGMVAYLISRDGAKKFLSRERVFRQIDEDTKYYWEFGLDIWSALDNPVMEISGDLGGSIVNDERNSMKTRHIARNLWGNVITADRKIRTRIELMREQKNRK